MSDLILPAVLALIAVGVAVIFIVASRREKIRDRQDELESDVVELDAARTLALKNEVCTRFRARYGVAKNYMNIPENAGVVTREANAFSLRGVYIRHYCWTTERDLLMFPLWESIEQCLDDSTMNNGYAPGDENILYAVTIPLASIESFSLEEDAAEKGKSAFVALKYANQQGEMVASIFPESAMPVFKTLLPEKEHSYIFTKIYPKSAQNISDIKAKMAALKDMWNDKLITDEEYLEKKKQLLILM